MRKANYDSFQTLPFVYPTTEPTEDIPTFSSVGAAVKAATEGVPRLRLSLSCKRLRSLPVSIDLLAQAPYLELDLSDNPSLNLGQTFKVLSKLSGLKALDLSGMRMGVLPPEIGLLESLEQLILYSNALDALPDELTHLQNLQYLNLHSNNIRDLSEVYALPQLQKLILRGNTFSKKEFGQIAQLEQLKYLDIRRCGVTRIPEEFSQLSQLQALNASANYIRQLPESVGGLGKLEYIDLRLNSSLKWDKILPQLAQLPLLTHLDLSQYSLRDLSPKISAMKQLRTLNLQSNLLTELPKALSKLPVLEEVKLQYNCDLNWKLSLEVLGKINSLKRLTISEVNDLKTLPDTLGRLHKVESLTIERMPLLEQLPKAIGKLKNLKHLCIHHCPKLFELPQAIERFTELKTLDLRDMNPFFAQLPTELMGLQKLEKLYLNGTDITELPKGIGQLMELKTFWVGDALLELPQEVAALTQLEELNLGKSVLKQLPEEVARLQRLRVLDFGACAQLDLEHTFGLMKQLKHVRTIKIGQRRLTELPKNIVELEQITEVDLRGCELVNLLTIVELLAQMPQLKVLRLKMGAAPLPTNLHLLAHLDTIQIDYPLNYLYRHEQPQGGIPLEWGWFTHTKIESNATYFDKTNQFIAEYGKEAYPKERKMFFFGVYIGNFDALVQYIANPLAKDNFNLERAMFFVTGKVSGFTQKELKIKLADYGVDISNKITPRVTHAVIGRFTKPEIVAQIFALPIAIVLEDYLKDLIWTQDQPYLMQDNTDEMTQNVLNLLMSDDEDNFKIALQIIEGGGANQQIITYLMAISLFHPDADIRKKSRKLFKKYASSDLQNHVRKHWSITLRQKLDSYFLNPLMNHPEIDGGEFMVMRIRVSWAGNYSPRAYMKESINLSAVNFNTLPHFLTHLTSVRKLNLQGNPQFDFDQAMEVLIQLPHLEELSLENCQLKALPKGVFALKKLKKLSLAHNGLTELPSNFSELLQLEELMVDHNPLKTIAPEFCRLSQLKKWSMKNAQLAELPADIGNLTQLKTLLLDHNQLKSLPASIEKLSQLHELQLSNNELKQLPEGLGKLKKIHRISLKNNKLKALPKVLEWEKVYKLDLSENELKTLPESISNCTFLNEIKLGHNRISSLPKSLSNLSITYFTLDLSHNGLKKLPAIISKIKQLRSLNISDNKLTTLPKEFCNLSELYYLRAANNQITCLPEQFGALHKLNNIDFSFNRIEELPDQLPPIFHSRQGTLGVLILYGNPLSPKHKTRYLKEFSGLRF